MMRVVGCIALRHDPLLVVLAACICALSCATTLNLMARSRAAGSWTSLIWLGAASIVFGCGVWSLHFVAMLAFNTEFAISYELPATIASVGVVTAGAQLALMVWRFSRSRRSGAVLGGLLLGLSVAGMHFSGVAAMRFPGTLDFDTSMMAASVVLVIGFVTVGFARSGAMSSLWRTIEVTGWWTLGICGLHFTAMAGLSMEPGPSASQQGAVLGSSTLALAVGSVSLAILIVSLAASLMEQHLSGRRELELQHMRLLSDIAHEALIIQRNGIILQVNAACGRLLGLSGQQLVGRTTLDFIAEADRFKVTGHLRDRPNDARAGQRPAGELVETPGEIRVDATAEISVEAPVELSAEGPVEVEIRTSAGVSIPVELTRGEMVYEGKDATVVSLRNLSDRKRDEAAIRHFAHHDTLTDLPNHLLLRERLAQYLTTAERSEESLALFYLNLDRFRTVNDLLGHSGGDALLIQVADRLRVERRSSDTLARIGGDVFVMIVVVTQPDDVTSLARRLIDVVARPFDVDGQVAEITASIGIALYPTDGGDARTLMHAADTALFRARQERRGTFHFFDEDMDDQWQARRQLEQDLRHAIERDELLLHYQPLVSCATGEVEGYEALIRWNHPERGVVSPVDFIPLAEEAGLIVPIGQWALETACRTAARWPAGEWVAVNLSPLQFHQPDLPERVAAVLAGTGLAADRLEIEVTEGVFINHVARAAGILSRLRTMGVRIALDDFGTGYSSLSYLHSYRVDKLKIDKSFIDLLGNGMDATMIVRAMIGLAHDLGLSIVAEGVETAGQLAIIRDLGCDLVQGYLLGRPIRMETPTGLTAARAKLLLFGNALEDRSPEPPDIRERQSAFVL